MTTPASAYPVPLDELAPQAQALADRIGAVPSLNLLMRELRIGKTKARALLSGLTGEQTDATAPSPDPDPDDEPPAVRPMAGPTAGRAQNLLADLDALIVDGLRDAESTEDSPVPSAVTISEAPETTSLAAVDVDPRPMIAPVALARKQIATWPVLLIALPAFVAIWSGWVGLGTLTGFGVVHPLPGIVDSFSLNTAVTLPVGVEVYAAYALRAWLAGNRVPLVARRFAKWSAIASLAVGSAGQVAYHLMESAGMTSAPWQITTAVSCLPVAVLGMGAALAHLLNRHDDEPAEAPRPSKLRVWWRKLGARSGNSRR